MTEPSIKNPRAGRDLVIVDAKELPHLKPVRLYDALRNIMANRGINTSGFPESFEDNVCPTSQCLRGSGGVCLFAM